MKILSIIFLLAISNLGYCQFSEQLLKNIRYATEDFYIARDTLNITGSKTLPCLDIKINGKGPYRFLIDLGSNVINFKASIVKDAGIKIVIDRDKGDIAMAEKINIGNSVFLNVYGAVYEDLDVDGVLGFNLLGKGNFMMDYPNLKFAFISDSIEQKDTSFSSYEVVERMPYLKSKIGSKIVNINFDTGASGWLYFPFSYKDSLELKHPIRPGKETWNNQTGITQSEYAEILDNVSFGNFTIKEPNVVFLPDIEDVFVGSSLLKDFKLSFYVSQKLVKMEREIESKDIIIPLNN
ncbi:MAG: hypothetical protein R2828_25765 [Saprospiraceae bacterium]